MRGGTRFSEKIMLHQERDAERSESHHALAAAPYRWDFRCLWEPTGARTVDQMPDDISPPPLAFGTTRTPVSPRRGPFLLRQPSEGQQPRQIPFRDAVHALVLRAGRVGRIGRLRIAGGGRPRLPLLGPAAGSPRRFRAAGSPPASESRTVDGFALCANPGPIDASPRMTETIILFRFMMAARLHVWTL